MNILFTVLSTLNFRSLNYYYKKDGSGNKFYCTGVSQQEPGAKFVLSNNKIDKIVVLATKETYKNEAGVIPDINCFHHYDQNNNIGKSKLSDWLSISFDTGKTTSLRVFLSRTASFVEGENVDEGIPLSNDIMKQLDINNFPKLSSNCNNSAESIDVVVVEDTSMAADSAGNIELLIKELHGTDNNTANIYLDIQGGSRTAYFVMSALLQLLKKSETYHCKLKKILATNYNRKNADNEIVDVTSQYNILDLFSGLSSFLSYGKADPLVQFLKDQKSINTDIDFVISRLCKSLQDIEYCISFGNFQEISDEYDIDLKKPNDFSLIKAITNLKNALGELKKMQKTDNKITGLFRILIDSIEYDMGDLLKGSIDEVDILALIEWQVKKNNYFAAATIAETYLPEYMVKHKVIYYAGKDDEEKESIKDAMTFYRLNQNWKYVYKFNDINHWFIKNYLPMAKLGAFAPGKKRDQEKKNNGGYITINSYSCSLNNANNKANYPIGVYYQDISQDIRAIDILMKYTFVSTFRNELAHPTPDSEVKKETVESELNKLIGLLKEYKRYKNDFVLDGDFIFKKFNAKESEITYDKGMDLAKTAIEKELASKSDELHFGIMQHSIRNEPYSKYQYKDLYFLSWLYPLFIKINNLKTELFNTDHSYNLEAIKHLSEILNDRECEPFLRLAFEWYKNSWCKDKECALDGFDTLKAKKFSCSNQPAATEKDAIKRIKGRLNSYYDFLGLIENLESHESWDAYILETVEKINKERDKGVDSDIEENIVLLKDFFSFLYNKNGKLNKSGWKKVIRYHLTDNEKLKNLIEKSGKQDFNSWLEETKRREQRNR